MMNLRAHGSLLKIQTGLQGASAEETRGVLPCLIFSFLNKQMI